MTLSQLSALPFYKGMMIPVESAHNRAEKRAILFEYKKILDRILKIEADFCTVILGCNYESYSKVYEHFNVKFQNELYLINTFVKPKHWILLETYFAETYKPIEGLKR